MHVISPKVCDIAVCVILHKLIRKSNEQLYNSIYNNAAKMNIKK